MAERTQLYRIEAYLRDCAMRQIRIELEQQQQTALLTSLVAGAKIMSTTADQTKATVDTLDSKVDTLIAGIQPGMQTLLAQLADAQTQIAALRAGDAADATTLQATIAAAQAEAAKVDAAIAALNPPAPTPTVA